MSPVLVPAFPAVLRAGLPVECLGYTNRGRAYAAQDVGDGGWMLWPNASGRYWPLTSLRLDLRDPAVRDAVVRAIWRKLRPTEPEPLTAPRLRIEVGRDREWTLWDEPGHGWVRFATYQAGPGLSTWVPVFALASIPLDSPDRDLLALAAVACAVLS